MIKGAKEKMENWVADLREYSTKEEAAKSGANWIYHYWQDEEGEHCEGICNDSQCNCSGYKQYY